MDTTPQSERIGRGLVLLEALTARPIRRGRRGEYKEMLERSMKHETHRDDQAGG